MRGLGSVVLGAVLAVAGSAGAAELSPSKLSLHLLGGRYSPGAREVVAAGPRVLKVLDLSPEMLDALRDYKARWPEGRTVLRIYTRRTYEVGVDPEEAGRDFWATVLQPPIERLAPEDRQLIDYLEGPNECEHYPVWESPETAAWFARFWAALAPLIAGAGLRPCVGSIPVGNPPGTPAEIEARFAAFLPALRAAHELGGAWSYHAYSLAYTTDLAEESWTSLRYRMLHGVLERNAPDLADLPLVLTEAGIDRGGNAQQDGWQARGTAEQFQEWLAWFDGRLREDDYVLGATLFQCGDTAGWPSFEVEPITGWLADHLRAPAAQLGPRG